MKYCLFLCFTFFFLFANGQNEKIYLNKEWKECAQSEASYYRIIDKSQQKSSGLYFVKDYYIDGILQMEGSYSDRELKIHQGDFIFYDEEGLKSKECSYKDDKLHGMLLLYKSGKIFNREPYLDGKREGKAQYYFENGQLSSVEFYEDGNLITYNMYNEDGSPAPQDDILNRQAEFEGGANAMRRFLSENLVYPTSAVVAELEGKCYLKFIVNVDGSITDVTIVKKVPGCPECDAEAVRVVELMSNWLPGVDHHRVVKSYFMLPLTFKLTGANPKKSRRR